MLICVRLCFGTKLLLLPVLCLSSCLLLQVACLYQVKSYLLQQVMYMHICSGTRNLCSIGPVRLAGAGGCCWSGVREKYCWLDGAGGCCWSGVRGKHCWLAGGRWSRTWSMYGVTCFLILWRSVFHRKTNLIFVLYAPPPSKQFVLLAQHRSIRQIFDK